MVKLMHEMPLRPKLLIAESEAEDTGMLYRTFVYRVAAGLRLEFSEAEDSQERPFYSEHPSLVCVSCHV